MHHDHRNLPAAAAIAAALAGTLATECTAYPEGWNRGRTVILLPASRILLEVSTDWRDTDRLHFAPFVRLDDGQLVRLRSHTRQTGTIEPSASVNATRPPAAIAADLRRRLLGPAVLNMARAALQSDATRRAAQADQAVILADLADALGAPFELNSRWSRSDEYHSRGVKFSTYALDKMQSGEGFEVEIRLRSRDALRQILRIVRADYELANPANPA